MRLAALVLVALLLSAAAAHAAGDPASDWLYTQKVFIPIDRPPARKQQNELQATVAGAWKQGFRIKVAVIGSAYDLGSVPSLWRKPRTYARFLGAELTFLYRQRLLIVMPNGFGFYWKGHKPDAAYATLARVRIPPGPNGLASAATAAVVRLARADGVTIAATKPPHDSTNRDRLIILAAILVLIALAVAGRLVLRRRRS
jgi:hypothetical protein